MHFNRFQQGDSVQYVGKKESLRSNLAGREGFVDSRVGGEPTLLCVTFGENSYLLDEHRDLAKYVKREKVDHTDRKGPEVQKRRGVSGEEGRKGGKGRRKGSDQE